MLHAGCFALTARAHSRTLVATTACSASMAAACAAASSARAARSRASAASASPRRAASTSADAARRDASRRTAASALRKGALSVQRKANAELRSVQHEFRGPAPVLHAWQARKLLTHPRRASAAPSAMAAAPNGVVPAPASDRSCKPFSKPDSGGGPPPPAALHAATADAPGCVRGEGRASDLGGAREPYVTTSSAAPSWCTASA